jgi:hypothetical protein
MAMKYYLVTDAVAEQVTRCTGLPAHDTFLGALVEQPKPFNLDAELDRLDRAMFPNKPRCICGRTAILHQPNCPMSLMMT